MLRKLRIVFAALFLIGITLLFVGIGQQWWGWMAKVQFLPAALALNAAVVAGILILCLLLGRLYCSVICPLGVFQDVLIWLRRALSPRRSRVRFKFHKENKVLRYVVLAVFIAALFAGIQVIVALLAPYSAYGRMVRAVAQPVWGVALIVPALTFAVIAAFALFRGREWCGSICPVGTLLSLPSRFSLFRIRIDSDKCRGCRQCEHRCKMSCIDVDSRSVDYSRCIDCFDCLDDCRQDAIGFGLAYRGRKDSEKSGAGTDKGRRAFVAGTAMLIGTGLASAQVKRLDGALAEVPDKKDPDRSERLVPFGAGSVKDFYRTCTACGLCIANCPNHVLRPSTDLEHLMQPFMSYANGYCRPECNVCSQVCPAGAISPLERGRKATISIGVASVDYGRCIVYRDGVSCGNCSRHCPSGAIRMVEKDGRSIPVVNENLCIGCGACENLCPSRPLSAITVNGLSVHQSR